jgi:glycosyltransferase involved in cell wall biosynthesis
MPKFSVTTPVTYDKDNADNLRMPRYEMFLRCANSVFTQTFTDWEWVIADDVSNPSVESVLEDIDSWWKPRGLQVKSVLLPEKSGRIIAQNAAMAASTGDWICWLDADDEYASTYLQMLDDAIKIYPDYKIFNFNHLIFGYDYKPYIREFMDMDEQGDKPFGSGHIGAGSFVFHRSVYEEIGPMPELGLWDFADKAFEEFPEIKQFFEKPGEPGQYNSLGNPWGQDYYYWYKMTRKFKAKKLNAAPYFVHSRWGHRLPDDPDYVVDPGKTPRWDKTNL